MDAATAEAQRSRSKRASHWRRALRVLLVAAFAATSPVPLRAVPRWTEILEQPEAWYASAEAVAVARHVIAYQTAVGGWPKNLDMTEPPRSPPAAKESTIDNGATTTQLRLLAKIAAEQPGDAALLVAIEGGIHYLLEAQYPNGGWPQYYPLRTGYSRHITFNDDAMARVLQVLRAVAASDEPFGQTLSLPAELRTRAQQAVQRGFACILASQVKVNGQLTAWCAQHDAVTLAPAPARRFEPVSLSGAETVGLIKLLLEEPDPSPAMIAAIEAGVAWLQEVKLEGWRVERPPLPDDPGRRDQVLVRDPDAPPLWARFYEVGTNRPIFAGRDAVIHYDLAAVEPERRSGYSYVGTWAARLLAKDYPRWQARRQAGMGAAQ